MVEVCARLIPGTTEKGNKRPHYAWLVVGTDQILVCYGKSIKKECPGNGIRICENKGRLRIRHTRKETFVPKCVIYLEVL